MGPAASIANTELVLRGRTRTALRCAQPSLVAQDSVLCYFLLVSQHDDSARLEPFIRVVNKMLEVAGPRHVVEVPIQPGWTSSVLQEIKRAYEAVGWLVYHMRVGRTPGVGEYLEMHQGRGAR